jgi:hypothetical protein
MVSLVVNASYVVGTPPNSLRNPNVDPRMKQHEKKIKAYFLARNTSGVGGMLELQDGTKTNSQTKVQDKTNLHNQGKKVVNAS